MRSSFQPQKGAQVFAGMRSSTTKGSLDPGAFGDFLKTCGKGDVIMKMMSVSCVLFHSGLNIDCF